LDPMALVSRHVAMPVYEAVKGTGTSRLYRECLRTQHLGEQELRARQLRAAQELLRYVFAHNRFYRTRYSEAGVHCEDVRTLEDFARLPPLTKDDIRANPDALVSGTFEKSQLSHRRTGGSTGVPVHVCWSRDAIPLKDALVRRHDAWAGFRPGERRAQLWGDIKPPATLKAKLAAAVFQRTIFLDTLKLDERNMLEFVEQIRSSQTRLLFGHGHSLFFLAHFVKERGIRDVGLTGIISSSEMLPPEERRVVEEVFGRIVFDRYGSEEVGLIASECAEHDGLHVAAEGIHVEIVDGSETEPGRILVTDLLNRGTPLIRYEIGDLATAKAGPCRCGRGLPRIGRVTGRTSDFLYTPDGRKISGISILDTVTIHIPGFKQVQVVQDKIDELTFNVVKDANLSDTSLARLADAVRRYFGPAMRHRVAFVDAIPRTGRGKFQFSICRVPDPGARPSRSVS
jgi:phenylacetate-CoA ligase